MRKIENLIGCKMKVDVTSKLSTDELIRALLSKYKSDLSDTLRLHRLEFLYDLIKNDQRRVQKSVDVEDRFVLAKTDDKVEESEEEYEKEDHLEKKTKQLQEDVVSVRPEDVDNWKDLIALSKAYYVLEHPNSKNLTWKRRFSKKKYIDKFSDKDLVEWRVAQQFRLRSLEEWALSRKEKKNLATKSSNSFVGLLYDQENRDLEDMFLILESERQEKPKMTKSRKSSMPKRPFKFNDESVEDWTESYSDDSDESGADEIEEDSLQITQEMDFEVEEIAEIPEEPEFDEESVISELFSSYKEIPPYKDPVFEKLESTESMKQWYQQYTEFIKTKPLQTKQKVLSKIIENDEVSTKAIKTTDSVSKVDTTVDSLEKMQKGSKMKVKTDYKPDARDLELGEISQVSPVPFNIASEQLKNQTFVNVDTEKILKSSPDQIFDLVDESDLNRKSSIEKSAENVKEKGKKVSKGGLTKAGRKE